MKQLENVRVLTTVALLVAIGIVLGFFKIPLSDQIQIYFTSIPVAITGFLFGPMVGFVSGILVDLGSFLVKPTGAFFPGFTLTVGLNGLIYGYVLWKKQGKWVEVGIAQLGVSIVSNWFGNSINLMIMYGTPLWTLLMARLPKEIIMFPIHAFMIYLAIQAIKKTKIKGLVHE